MEPLSSMYALDVAMTSAINGFSGQHAFVDSFFVWTSAYGIPVLVLAVAVQWWGQANRQQTRHLLVSTGLSFLLGLALNQLILVFVSRIRPYDAGVTQLLISPSVDPSFPSDHATAAAAIAIAFLVGGQKLTGTCFLAVAVLIMTSRVYIGTHYLSDVLGGLLTGIAGVMIVRKIYTEGTKLDRFVTSIL